MLMQLDCVCLHQFEIVLVLENLFSRRLISKPPIYQDINVSLLKFSVFYIIIFPCCLAIYPIPHALAQRNALNYSLSPLPIGGILLKTNVFDHSFSFFGSTSFFLLNQISVGFFSMLKILYECKHVGVEAFLMANSLGY